MSFRGGTPAAAPPAAGGGALAGGGAPGAGRAGALGARFRTAAPMSSSAFEIAFSAST